MAWLDDIGAAAARFDAWADSVAQSVTEWAASERGQQILMGVDFLPLSTRIGDFYARVGWYLPVHPSLHRYALQHLEYQVPFDPREATRRIGPGSPHWSWIVEGTLASPTLETRAAVVEDAVFCLENERWHAAISTLLPVIEGVVSDRSGVLQDMRVGRRVDHILDKRTGPWETLSAVPALDVLDTEIFERCDFDGVEIAEEALNRHLILHGRTAGFGTRRNAFRIFLLLIALAELLDGAVMLRASSPPVDAGSYLDEHGPLAALRTGAVRRAA